jgi:hypothetical protein
MLELTAFSLSCLLTSLVTTENYYKTIKKIYIKVKQNPIPLKYLDNN